MQNSPSAETVSSIEEAGIRGLLHRPVNASSDGLVITHGAGANCRSPLLTAVANEFCSAGVTVLRYDLPFRQLRPFGPPRGSAEKDQQGIALAVEYMRRQVKSRVFAGGHSYGGRQTTMLAALQPELVNGLLLLSYPLHPPKSPNQLRTGHFPDLRTPALLVHGTRDGFGTIDELSAALRLIPSPTELFPVEGAGHELLSKRNEKELPKLIVEAFTRFILI
jgi:predicted alpha/beta-hydrolase family hydrolase